MEQKKQLSIALFSSYAFTKDPGGVKDFILGLKKALQRQGCKVFVIAPGSQDALGKNQVDFVLGKGFKIATDQTAFRVSFSRKETAKKILGLIKPDVIAIHEPYLPSVGYTIISSITKAKNGRHPVIIGQFHASREDLNWPLKAVEFVFRHSSYLSTINNNLDGRIAVSRATKNFWQEKFPSQYKVIYNGIDTKELSIEGPKIKKWLKNGQRIVFFAGRHDSRKGISDLIRAFKILVQEGHENIRLKIAGFGEMTAVLREMVKKLDLQKYIQFVGVLPREELVKAYRTADLVVAPSTGGEGFNRTIIEARSCGRMVICTDIEGHKEAIGKDLFPFMAKPKNPRSLARQIMTVLNLPETKKQEIKRRGREDVISHFDWDKIAREHLEYYKKMINDKE